MPHCVVVQLVTARDCSSTLDVIDDLQQLLVSMHSETSCCSLCLCKMVGDGD